MKNQMFQPRGTLIFLGATDFIKEGQWLWETNGTNVTYARFNPGEPNGNINENCLGMLTESGNWADVPCQSTYSYHVCEKPTVKPPPPPPIIDSKFN
jgi:hypothetical protein